MAEFEKTITDFHFPYLMKIYTYVKYTMKFDDVSICGKTETNVL